MYYNITKTYNQQLSTYPLSAETLKNFEIILTSFVEQNPSTSKKKIFKTFAEATILKIFDRLITYTSISNFDPNSLSK